MSVKHGMLCESTKDSQLQSLYNLNENFPIFVNFKMGTFINSKKQGNDIKNETLEKIKRSRKEGKDRYGLIFKKI